MTAHRPHQTEDGLLCSCGSERCIVLREGVWTPSARIDGAELASARVFLTSDPARTFAAGCGGISATMQRPNGQVVVWTWLPRRDT